MAKSLQPLGLFPLTGTVVLPGTFLPLNVFENRYLNLVADALTGNRLIGIVQPRIPAFDDFGPASTSAMNPELYAVGGLGRISDWQREEDGRYLIVLEGVGRFDIAEELDLHRGYRRVRAVMRPDEDPLAEEPGGVRDTLLSAVLDFSNEQDITVDEDVLTSLPAWRLINVLSVALPFEPAERQLLLETDGLGRRAHALIELLRMSVAARSGRRPGRLDRARSVTPGMPN